MIEQKLGHHAVDIGLGCSLGGPASTITGFTKGSQRLVYALETEPPRGTCQDVPLADCKVPHQRWSWRLKVVAFTQ